MLLSNIQEKQGLNSEEFMDNIQLNQNEMAYIYRQLLYIIVLHAHE